MKRLLLLLTLLIFSCGSDEPNPCVIAMDFIKEDLKYPEEAEHSIFDCSKESNSDGTYTVLTKVKAKNALGVQSSYIYKLRLKFIGGISVDEKNWQLLKMQSEEAR